MICHRAWRAYEWCRPVSFPGLYVEDFWKKLSQKLPPSDCSILFSGISELLKLAWWLNNSISLVQNLSSFVFLHRRLCLSLIHLYLHPYLITIEALEVVLPFSKGVALSFLSIFTSSWIGVLYYIDFVVFTQTSIFPVCSRLYLEKVCQKQVRRRARAFLQTLRETRI